MSTGQWLLVTLTTGVGAVCSPSAPLPGGPGWGRARACIPFVGHLKWLPAILLGYMVSIGGASVAQQRPVLRDLRRKMGQLFGGLSPRHVAFIEAQKIFFVGTAAGEGTVNVSPRAGTALRVSMPTPLSWLNLTGSGNESAAHVPRNPRMTVMFQAFEGATYSCRPMAGARVLHRGQRLGGSAGTLSQNVAARRDLPAGH